MAPILNLISRHQPLAVLLSRSEQFMKNVHLICCTTWASNCHPKQLEAVFVHCFIVFKCSFVKLVRLGYPQTKCDPFDLDSLGHPARLQHCTRQYSTKHSSNLPLSLSPAASTLFDPLAFIVHVELETIFMPA